MSDPIVIPSDQAPAALKLVGEEITILASGAQTGSYEVFRQAGPEGSGPPPHRHPWDEAFYVTDGTLHFGLAADELVAPAGTFVHVPAGTMHWFRFGDGGGEMISLTSREGASKFFVHAAQEISPEEPDLGALIGIAATHGLDIPVPT